MRAGGGGGAVGRGAAKTTHVSFDQTSSSSPNLLPRPAPLAPPVPFAPGEALASFASARGSSSSESRRLAEGAPRLRESLYLASYVLACDVLSSAVYLAGGGGV